MTPAAARAGDQAAVDAGDHWTGLMRRAAGHLARAVVTAAGRGYGLRVVVLAGKGDNGGDGWAAAGLLAARGAGVVVVAVDGVDTDASEATSTFRSRWLAGPGRTVGGTDSLDALLHGADVVVDCLLGTGTTGAPRGAVLHAVRSLARACARRPDLLVVACDVPTGVDAGTGAVPGDAVTADVTVTFGAAKRGLLLAPGVDHVGRLVIGSLGPRYAADAEGWAALTAAGAVPMGLPPDAEKRTRGVALAVAGSTGTAGAASLCTRGLLAGGAGLVTAAVPAPILATVAATAPAAMTIPLEDDGGVVAPAAADRLAGRLGEYDVVVAGPGLRPAPGTRAVVDALLAGGQRVVLDADALNVFRDDPDALADHPGELVLTPHVRELARLDGDGDVDDRADAAIRLAGRLRATVVAKGPATIVAGPDGRVWVVPVRAPALATGGTGDVLAGLVAAATATAPDVPLAVARAVWQHAFAGAVLGADRAGRLTADDLVDGFQEALVRLADLAHRQPAWPLDGTGHAIEEGTS